MNQARIEILVERALEEGLEDFLLSGTWRDFEDDIEPADFQTLARAARALDEADELIRDLEARADASLLDDDYDDEEDGFETEPE